MILSAHEIAKRLYESGCINDRPDGCIRDTPARGCHNTGAPDGIADTTTNSSPAEVYDLIISPFSGECLQPASYDLRVAHDTVLPRGACSLVPTLEWVELPADLAATLRCRSSFGRKGGTDSSGVRRSGVPGAIDAMSY